MLRRSERRFPFALTTTPKGSNSKAQGKRGAALGNEADLATLIEEELGPQRTMDGTDANGAGVMIEQRRSSYNIAR